MLKKILRGLPAVLFCLVFASAASAEIDFSYGGNLRLRQEYWGKAFDLDLGGVESRNYLRLKASVWGQLKFDEDVALYLKLTSEPLYFFNDEAGDSGYASDELFIDNLYLDWRNAAGLPVDLRLGRFDLLGTYGEGFLVMDGATLAGSRAFYFDGARATWRMTENNSLDFVYINNQAVEEYLPVVNDKNRALNRSDEWAAMLYSRNRIGDRFTLEPYYIYKREQMHAAPELTIKTIGASAVYRMDPWRFRGQLARQFGDYSDGTDRNGAGGYLFADRSFNEAALKPQVTAGFAYLSGDDQATAKSEGWNPLFSRYPWMSELLIFTYAGFAGSRESDIAYWTNLQLYRVGARFEVGPDTNLQVNYNYLRANEDAPALAMFGTGRERGHLPQATLSHRFCENLDGLVMLEYFVPGSYYAAGADNAVFFRWQLQYRF